MKFRELAFGRLSTSRFSAGYSASQRSKMCLGIGLNSRPFWTHTIFSQSVRVMLNRMLNGWANYFCLGPVSNAYRAVERHTGRRLRQWLCAKHKVRGMGIGRFSDAYLHDVLGLVRLITRTRSVPWAKP